MAEDERMTGLSAERVRYLKSAIEKDVAEGLYQGAAIIVARNGHVALREAIGRASSQDPAPVRTDSVFSLFSLTKAFTNIATFRSIERGDFALTTRISQIIPEFSGLPRANITVEHLLTHCTGLPGVFTPRPGMNIDRLDEIIEAICEHLHASEEPGDRVNYSPMAAHALLGEMVRRTDSQGRGYRQIITDDILAPLGMNDTAVGVRADLRSRHIVPEFPPSFPARHPGRSNLGPNGAFEEEDSEMPWVGMVSTVGDIFRFAEMLRRGGELDGKRIIGSRILNLAIQNRTGEKPNELYRGLALARGWRPYPAYIGLGFALRGTAICHTQFGTLASPGTFGNFGAGSTLFWIDPELQMTFACLTTGLLPEGDNIERFQRLSDMALAAAV